MTPKQLLLAFTLLLQACNDGLGEDAYEPERETAMPLASGPYEDMLRREESIVQVVPPVPNMQAPWSGSPNLGNTVDFAPDANSRQTVLKLDEWGPPEMWTITLGMETAGWEPLQGFAVIAEITYGSGGATQTITIDWATGARISLPMNSVSIVARYEPLTSVGFTVPIVPETLRLTALIARGADALADPTYTIWVAGVWDGNDRVYRMDIPPFARTYEMTTGDTSQVLTNSYMLFRSNPAALGAAPMGYQQTREYDKIYRIIQSARSMELHIPVDVEAYIIFTFHLGS